VLTKINVQDVVSIAKEAGDAIMQIYVQDFEVEYKQDNSPMTLADKKANVIIEVGLRKLPVSLPILSEERVKRFLMKKEDIGSIFG
jgi:3'(2'), 5'-bisphosphate nucleotidase